MFGSRLRLESGIFFSLSFPFARRRRISDAFRADDRSHALVA